MYICIYFSVVFLLVVFSPRLLLKSGLEDVIYVLFSIFLFVYFFCVISIYSVCFIFYFTG